MWGHAASRSQEHTPELDRSTSMILDYYTFVYRICYIFFGGFHPVGCRVLRVVTHIQTPNEPGAGRWS